VFFISALRLFFSTWCTFTHLKVINGYTLNWANLDSLWSEDSCVYSPKWPHGFEIFIFADVAGIYGFYFIFSLLFYDIWINII
jgi:hypothetical protein